MFVYDQIFGIYFLPPILSVLGRIHRIKTKAPEHSGDFLNLDSDAEHQSEKWSIRYSLSPQAIVLG